ncbi:Omp28-related outer membrane protein [Brumimicrobium mesophilum]|uniref:Omp28-related outer membrane protein n=1 Tax=Brumimicrobium mesophilum TaxID=392717 RepID=UPI000D14096D|nr:Omp28-related outer membrane protein [Brumimicrobium mesophilum]
MKKLQKYFLFLFGASVVLTSCDKVDNPYEKVVEINLDTTLYDGAWSDYLANEYPTFPSNTNTNVNVLIEDYTGHTCISCPTAADIAHDIHINNPDRVFVASIHTGPGSLSFQAANPNNPKFFTDHTNPDGIAYGDEFKNGFGFFGNPQGTVNRKEGNGQMFSLFGVWQSRTDDILNANELKFDIQSVFNYYTAANGGYLHVEVEKKTTEAIQLNTVVYVIEDSLVDWQKMPDNTDNEFYVHRDKHLGSIDNNAFGISTFMSDASSGDKKILDYSYVLPQGLDKENMHFLIYVYDVDTYEILQVIKQKIE